MKDRIMYGLELIFIFICVLMAMASVENASMEPSEEITYPKEQYLA